jgi:colanic acid biosynthesis glycosyl transferase WcaI
MKPDIYLLTQVFPPDSSSTSQLFARLVEFLGAEGIRLKVFSAFPHGHSAKKSEHGENWEVQRLSRFGRPSHRIIVKLYSYFTYCFALAGEMLRLSRSSRVMVLTNPPFLPIWVWFFSRARRFQYQLMILDLYPEGLEQVGLIEKGGYVSKIWRALNLKAFRSAAGIAVLGRDMRTLIVSTYGVDPEKVHWIPHWSSLETNSVRSLLNNGIVRKLALNSKWIVQYSGNMGLWHDMDNIVEAAHQLRNQTEIHFLLVGGGVRKDNAKRLAENYGLSNITWMDPVPLNELEELLAACNIALISQREGLYGVAVPCKLYGILSAGRPVLAAVPGNCEVALVLNEENCGAVVPPHDPRALATTIRSLYRDQNLLQEMGRRARQAYLKNYTINHAAQRLQDAWAHVFR